MKLEKTKWAMAGLFTASMMGLGGSAYSQDMDRGFCVEMAFDTCTGEVDFSNEAFSRLSNEELDVIQDSVDQWIDLQAMQYCQSGTKKNQEAYRILCEMRDDAKRDLRCMIDDGREVRKFLMCFESADKEVTRHNVNVEARASLGKKPWFEIVGFDIDYDFEKRYERRIWNCMNPSTGAFASGTWKKINRIRKEWELEYRQNH